MINWTDAFTVVIAGLLIVFIALILLIGAVYLMGAALKRGTSKPNTPDTGAPAPKAPAAASAPAAPAAAPKMQVQSGIEEETVAVISAAVASVMGQQPASGSWAVTSISRSRDLRPVWGFAGMQQNTRPF